MLTLTKIERTTYTVLPFVFLKDVHNYPIKHNKYVCVYTNLNGINNQERL